MKKKIGKKEKRKIVRERKKEKECKHEGDRDRRYPLGCLARMATREGVG